MGIRIRLYSLWISGMKMNCRGEKNEPRLPGRVGAPVPCTLIRPAQMDRTIAEVKTKGYLHFREHYIDYFGSDRLIHKEKRSFYCVVFGKSLEGD